MPLEQRSQQRPNVVRRAELLAERLAHRRRCLPRLVDHSDVWSECRGECQVGPAHDRHAARQLFEDARLDHVDAVGGRDRVRDADRTSPVDGGRVSPCEPARGRGPGLADGWDDVIDRCLGIGL